MKAKEITEANRAAWDEAAPLHRRQNLEDLKAAFRKPGYSCLSEIETSLLLDLGIKGKDIAQLCCNNGRELLSLKNLGAAHCVGFDGAAGFIDPADILAQEAGLDCTFVCTDIYDIDAGYAGMFDLVVITIGVLAWMPDLAGFFKIAERLVRPGGAIFIYEQHPIMEMIEAGGADDPLEWKYSYFKREAYIDTEGLDYYGGGSYDSKPLYSYTHKMSDIITAGIDLRLMVAHFAERPEHISNTWYNAENREPQLPMSFTLIFRKPQ